METGITAKDFDLGGGMKFKGMRRPLRMPLRDVSFTPLADDMFRLTFALPAGCYATSVLREITKSDDD